MPTKVVPIRYTSREFNSIKADLVEYAKRYYPDTFQDFNEASFGALMLDTVAYVGDVLSFYLDYQVNESFLDTAVEYNNVLRIGRQLGYKHAGFPSSHGEVMLYMMIPANATGLGPDTDYLPILQQGSVFASKAGGVFSLSEDIDFLNAGAEVVVGKVNKATGVPTHYAVKTTGKVVSGALRSKLITVGDFERFKRVRVGSRNISEIIDVTDSEGNRYHEVEHLSQNVIYSPIINTNSDKDVVVNILKPILAPRRFAVERVGSALFLQFGYGSDSELSEKSVKDPRNVVMNMHARNYITDKEFDPSKLLKTDKFGICPTNTTLTITYRINNPGVTAASAGALSEVRATNLRWRNSTSLSANKMAEIRQSVEVNNDEPITGAQPETTAVELKRRIMGHFAAQNRAVTRQDYLALCYTMPAQYGFVKRANILQDPDSFKRNLNLYVIGQNSNRLLAPLTNTAKENLKVWLNQNRMINDTVDIFDAKVVNYGVEYILKAHPSYEKNALLAECNRTITSALAGANNVLDIGEPLYISNIYTMLNRLEGVLDVKSVKIVPKDGTLYSDASFDFADQRSADGTYIAVPDNVVLELKYPGVDIQGTIK
mgnify:CR=1 FL=1